MAELQIKISDSLSILQSMLFTWTRDEEISQNIKLGSADGAYSVDISNVDNIKAIIVSGDSPCTLTITKNAATDTVSVESLFMLIPSESYRDLLESISITALNSTADNFNILIYGET